MNYLYWHKHQLVILKPKIKGLPDDHHFKLECLLQLSQVFEMIGNWVECKRLLTLTLKLQRERGDDHGVALVLRGLSYSNWHLDLIEEGIE